MQVIATANYASIPLITREDTFDELRKLSPMAKSLVLEFDHETKLTSCHAMLRFISSLTPASQLQGDSEISRALVDGWLDFCWNSLEIPLQVMEENAAVVFSSVEVAKSDIHAALAILENQFQENKHLVGDNVTLADISIVVVLHKAVSLGVEWKLAKLQTWFESMTQLEFLQKAIRPQSTLEGNAGCSELPAVVDNLYQHRRIRIKEALTVNRCCNQTIAVAGWARTIRSAGKGKLLFVELNDGSTVQCLQCVLDITTTKNFEQCKASGGTGAAFEMVGRLVPSQGRQTVELQVITGTLLGAVHGGTNGGIGGQLYPLSKKRHSLEHMRENAHLRNRARLHAAVMRCRHAMTVATHNFFHNKGFVHCDTPILTATDFQGSNEKLTVVASLEEGAEEKRQSPSPQNFFGRPIHLTTSGQFHAETVACSLGDVYTVGPRFRVNSR